MQGGRAQTYRLTAEDWDSINALVEEKYRQWDWNYVHLPDFDIQRTRHFAAGVIDFRLKVKRGGAIENVKITATSSDDYVVPDPVNRSTNTEDH